ncbi:hypothetical protein [Microbispora sp. NBRC 16548]|uniref:hypothetical protein n=1 Tax=Microbispora sp. NBRC 16548 TaxID=3030994 RepID=UPI0024A5B9B0|nr:hypothetical protein [Microbispora sp. NBRC 16548]GLX10678.1 hypothetical protein Misp03_76040 [Microbispora sp. NBRC 16548]
MVTLQDKKSDPALAALVDIVNSLKDPADAGPGVVLTVGGLVISGEVIPNWLWSQAVQEAHREARFKLGENVRREAQGWEILFENLRDQFVSRRDEIDATREILDNLPERYQTAILETDETTYIHLKDAKVYSPGQGPFPANGMYWRGQLSAITGWSFGLLSEVQDN